MIFADNGITILDPTMEINEIKIIKSVKELLGFSLVNETGVHLFVEPTFDSASEEKVLVRLVIRIGVKNDSN